MTQTIDLGSGVTIPTAEYAIQANAILGIRDTGKTYTATYVAEKLMDAGVPIVVFDPIGVWRSLRDAKDEFSKSYPVIIIGDDGDLELNPETIESIVLRALETRSSIVFDLFSTRVMKSDWDSIVAVAIRTLFYNNKRYGIRHIFFEESAEFIHQQGKKTESFEWIDSLVRQAGNLRIGCTFINQRAEQMHKAILELCEGLILHCQRGRLSIKAVQKWLESANLSNASEITASLAMLQKGECWVWSGRNSIPQHVQRIPQKQTLHPERHVSLEDYFVNNDIQSVIAGLKEESAVAKPVRFETPVLYNTPVFEIKPVKDNDVNVDWSSVQMDSTSYSAMLIARQTRYAGSTVKNVIDNLVMKGFDKLEESGVVQLITDDGRTFILSDEIQINYAKALLKYASIG